MLRKDKWNTIEVLICKYLTNSYMSYDVFVSVNHILKENCKIKKQKSWNFSGIHYIKIMETCCVSAKNKLLTK